MIAFAAHEFSLDAPQNDGVAKRAHLESVARQTGKRPAALDGPEMPRILEYLWAWFNEISYGRGQTGFGPARLSWHDIAAWCALQRLCPENWELKALMMLDAAWFRAMHAANPSPPDNKGARHG